MCSVHRDIVAGTTRHLRQKTTQTGAFLQHFVQILVPLVRNIISMSQPMVLCRIRTKYSVYGTWSSVFYAPRFGLRCVQILAQVRSDSSLVGNSALTVTNRRLESGLERSFSKKEESI